MKAAAILSGGLMDQKNEMVKLIEFVRRELDALCDQLTAEEKTRRGSLQMWSAKDMLAHLAFWNSHFNRQAVNALEGKNVPQAGDYTNQLNDGVLYEHLDQPFEEARADEAAAYRQFREIIDRTPAADLSDPQKFAYLEGRSLLERILGTYGYHTAAHLSDYYVKTGRFQKGRELQENLTERLCAFPVWKANAIYNLACFYSLNGLSKEAIEKLKIAFDEKPGLIEWSRQDSDIDPLREMAEYRALISI
jgi:tetratricopeptide (TPR) repeat protein